MAKGSKSKDLDPKARAKKIRGGNLPEDKKNINRSVTQIKNAALRTVRSVGPTAAGIVHDEV